MRVLIAEQHDLVREGLKAVLARLGVDANVRACASFADALGLAKHEAFDLVLLDRALPGMNGVAGVEVFRAYFPDPRIVVLADEVRKSEVVQAIHYGASGFVPKSLKIEALLSALRLIFAGECYVPAELISAEVLFASGGAPSLDGEADGAFRNLTEREAEVLERLLDGLTNKEIGRALDIQEVTVKLHLRSVYRKLGVKNRAQAVGRALKFGWRR
ncbi:MAG: response regulator transcription factor [Alphaproteobacteria bacterium]